MIKFQFEGVDYHAPIQAYETDIIQLPDGRQLRVDAWLESNPPVPSRISLTANQEHFVVAQGVLCANCGYCGQDMTPGSECSTSTDASICAMYDQYSATHKLNAGGMKDVK